MFPKTQHLPEDKLANLVIRKLASKAKEKINTYFTQHNLNWTAANISIALRTAYILPADKTRARRQVWHLEQHNRESTKKYLNRFQDVAVLAESDAEAEAEAEVEATVVSTGVATVSVELRWCQVC
ncbi:hypothetical protein HK102_012098 [Quaeritorhiza haematococci]|nr:hypothetical protein HK102_012098 [Quaeritorhiza haematococci]